ncbi:hypothetical protein CHU98_g10633 [Xylaria longipes]|nr:hypothetical protein CHU98_g10633 [Xylaria longipes]
MKSFIRMVKRVALRIISPLKRRRPQPSPVPSPPSPTTLLNRERRLEALAKSKEDWRKKQQEWEESLHKNGLLDGDLSGTSSSSKQPGASSSAPNSIQADDNGVTDSQAVEQAAPLGVSRNASEHKRKRFLLESSSSDGSREDGKGDRMPPLRRVRRIPSGTWFSNADWSHISQ